jgi:hypothetical protein
MTNNKVIWFKIKIDYSTQTRNLTHLKFNLTYFNTNDTTIKQKQTHHTLTPINTHCRALPHTAALPCTAALPNYEASFVLSVKVHSYSRLDQLNAGQWERETTKIEIRALIDIMILLHSNTVHFIAYQITVSTLVWKPSLWYRLDR